MSTASDPFMIRAHVPHWEASVADYRAASAATRATLPNRRNLAYGDGRDETLDLFFPPDAGTGGDARPIHMFVHGGYWRAFAKEDYSFLADAITAAGAIAAVVDYSLMPMARMETLVGQVRRAALWLRDHAVEFGGDPGAISASGHSAGAHLASFLVCRAPGEAEPDLCVRAVLLVSGIYHLAPIMRSFLQPELMLTEDEVARWSPIRATPIAGADIRIAVGEAETKPFRRQADEFTRHLGEAGRSLYDLRGQDHMTIVRDLGRPGSEAASHLLDTIRASIRNRG